MEKASVAKNLRYQRKRKGLTQEQLSEMSGVAVRTIQRIENAKVEPHLQTLSLLAEPLGLDVHELSLVAAAKDTAPDAAAETKWLLLLHLLPLAGFVVPFLNLVLPLVLWAYKRDENPLYDAHGRAVVNFQLTVTFAFMAGVVLLVLLFEAGILLLILTTIYALALITRNSRRVIKHQSYSYPLSLKIL